MNAPITTTLNRISECFPCGDEWKILLEHLGKTEADDEPLPFSVILEATSIECAICCCLAEPQYDRKWRQFAIWCARQVQHLLRDQRSFDALEISERYIKGEASDDELRKAYGAAYEAAIAIPSDAAHYAASAAAETANDAFTHEASWDAAVAAGHDASCDGIYDPSWEAARTAARASQAYKFLEIVGRQ